MKTKTKVKKESPFAKIKRENTELWNANQRHRARVDELEKMLVKASSEADQWEKEYRRIKNSIGRLVCSKAGMFSVERSEEIAANAMCEIFSERGECGRYSIEFPSYPIK